MNNLGRFISFAILATMGFACTYDNLSDLKVDCNTVLPDTVSFSKNVVPIIENNCSISGCHTGASPAGKLNLQTSTLYATITKKGSGYVDTIDPRASVIYSSMTSVTDPMPPTGKLDDCTIAMIEKWMKQKAKKN